VAFLFSPDLLDPEAKLEAHPTADLYCLGVMLYEALTEQSPFSSKQPLPELLTAILHTPPADPLQLNPQAPASLAALCLRLLSKEPQSRPQSAQAMREELERLRAEEGHTAPWQQPSPPPEDTKPMSQAHRWARAGTVLALGLGVLALGWGVLRTQGASSVHVPRESLSLDSSSAPSNLCRLLQGVLGGMAAGWLAGCATTPPSKPPDPLAFLARCSTEARITPRTLGFHPRSLGPNYYWYPAFFTMGTPASSQPIEEGGPLNIRSGPVQAIMYARVGGKDVGFPVEGEAVVTRCRVWVEVHRIQAPSGGWLPLCGVASMGIEQEWGLSTYACEPSAGTPPDPALVDTRPGSAVLNDPRMEVFVQPTDARVTPSFLRMPPPERR
jgi:serine/threonine-protein kinase